MGVKHGGSSLKDLGGYRELAYDTREIGSYLSMGGKANIEANLRRKSKCGKLFRFNIESYKHMGSAVEELSTWLSEITIRWEELESIF